MPENSKNRQKPKISVSNREADTKQKTTQKKLEIFCFYNNSF
jgi:hypothetical protein